MFHRTIELRQRNDPARLFDSTYHDNVTVEILSDINIALHDGVEGGSVDSSALKTKYRWLEEGFGGAESLVPDGDNLAVRKLVRFLQAGALAGGLDLLFEVKSNVAELLLHVTDDFTLGGGGKGITALGQNLHKVVGKITTGHVNTRNGVRKRKPFVNGDNVGHTVTGVEDDTGGTTGSVQRQNGLDRDVESRSVECLENNLCHLLAVGFGVDRGLGEQNRVFLGRNAKLVVESVVPNLFHIVPIGNNTMFNGIPQGQDTTLRLRLVTNVRVLLTHADHDTEPLLGMTPVY